MLLSYQRDYAMQCNVTEFSEMRCISVPLNLVNSLTVG